MYILKSIVNLNAEIVVQPKILKEPTFHFLILAAVISLSYWLLNLNSENQIQIDQEEIDARILVAELTQGYTANSVQREQIEKELIDDYLLVLEAYELGLQNDARINDILAQKMRHVLSGNIIQPTQEELETFYANNISRYTSAPRVTADEVVFNTTEPLPELITTQLAQGVLPEDIDSELTSTSGILPQVTQRDFASIFSEAFASQIFSAQLDAWVGPYTSNRGQHWLRIAETFPAATAPLDQIADQVRLDWIIEEEEERLAEEIAILRSEYTITIVEQE